jgi:triosephosphate isomerase
MRYVIANWKMNMTLKKVNTWLNEFEKLIQDTPDTTIIIAASFIHLPIVKFFADKYPNIAVAAQDVSLKEMGAHTGEIGIEQIKEFCSYCIVGHSELNEDENTKKIKAKICFDNGVIPILCSKNPKDEWKNSLPKYLLSWEDPSNISVNGVYKEKPFDDIYDNINELVENEGYIKVIYGGSVNENNSEQLSKMVNLRGVLPGNASLNPNTFWKIVQDFEKNKVL